MSLGFTISMPLLDSSPYDCILDNGKSLYKIQVKSISLNKKKSSINSWKLGLKRQGDFYKIYEVDYFAIWHAQYNGFFIIKNYQQQTLVINKDGKYKKNFDNFAVFY